MTLLVALARASCTAPATYIDNAEGHTCYLDGVRETRPRVPFRYYGTSRIDVVPIDNPNGPDFDRQPMSVTVPLPPPASPWLFPFDFFVEIFERTVHGRGDVVAVLGAPPTPTELRVDPELRPLGIDDVNRRAHAARIAR